MNSKKDSLYDVILDIQPQMALFTETHLKTNASFKIDNYSFFGKTRDEKSAGGVGILIRNDLKHCVTPHLSNGELEIMWASIKRKRGDPLMIGVYYGKQESRTSKEGIENEMDMLRKEIMEMKCEGEILIVMDGNGKIGLLGEPVSRNGRMLMEVFKQTELEIMNLSTKCEGKVTRIAKRKNEQNSAIDFVVASQGFSHLIKKINIDEEGLHRLSGKCETDHNSIIIETNLCDIQKIQTQKRVSWRLNAPEQKWSAFRTKLESFSGYSYELMNDRTKTLQERYDIWMKTFTKVINETIGKTTHKGDKNEKFGPQIMELRRQKREVKKNFRNSTDMRSKEILKCRYVLQQKRLQLLIKQERAQKIKDRFEKMVAKGSRNDFWKERRNMQKDNYSEWMVTKDISGKRLYDPDANKENIANYYENLYKREHKQSHVYHNQVELELKLMEKDRNNENYEDCKTPDLKVIEKAIINKKNKKSTTDLKNELLKRGGPAAAKAIHAVIQAAWQEEIVPSQWNESFITSVWKKKGDREILKNHRGISVSSTIGMVMEEIINNKLLDKISFTQAQGGGIKGYSTCDHVFLIRSLITYSIKMKRKIILTFYDVEKAYDHAERGDMLHVLWKRGIRGKVWRITKALNEDLTSRVKTPYGISREIKREVGGKQGGKIMTTMFSKTMDVISEIMEQKNDLGIQISDLKLAALLFVDDVTTITDNYVKQEKTLETMHDFAEMHSIKWSADKCAVMEIGGHDDYKQNWKLGNQQINHQDTYKYLGDIIDRNGRNLRNIEHRLIKVKQSTYSIITCAKNEIMQRIEIQTMLKLHETVNIPVLLHNCESWTLTKTDDLNIEKIEIWALKLMLNLPCTTPSVAIRYITGTLYTKTRIQTRQLLYLWRILNRPADSWTKKILMILDEYNLGWARQIRDTSSEFDLRENWEEIQSKTKSQWTAQVKLEAEKLNRKRMLNECFKEGGRSERKTKTRMIVEKIESNKYERKPIISIVTLNGIYSKTIIMAQFGMLDCAKNYRMKYGTNECKTCKKEDDEQHRLTDCPKWKNGGTNDNVNFSDVYSDDTEVLKKVAKEILKVWEIHHGKNQMKH